MNVVSIRPMVLFISASSFLFLVCPATVVGISYIFVLGIFLLFYYFKNKEKVDRTIEITTIPPKTSICLILLVIDCFLFQRFFSRWKESGIVGTIASVMHVPQMALVVVTGTIISICALYFMRVLLGELEKSDHKNFINQCFKKEGLYDGLLKLSFKENLILLICSFVIITICSRSSFLYPMNNWDDANTFFTVGKSMFNGMVPYKDLFEQKGPLLYLIFGVAYLISNDTFFGVYIIEIIASFIFLKYSYLITALLLKRKYIIIVPLLALFSFTSAAFEQGASCEEMALPFLSYSLCLMLKSNLTGITKKKDMFVIGIVSGCVFWLKFTLVGIYLGWYLVYLFFSPKRKGEIIANTSLIALGVLLATLPWIIYFGFNNAIKDWLIVYIYDNLFVYTQNIPINNFIASIPLVGKLLNSLYRFGVFNTFVFIMTIICVVVLYEHKTEYPVLSTMCMIFSTFFFIFAGGRSIRYYSLPLSIFLPIYIPILFGTFIKRTEEISINKDFVLIAVSCMVCSFLFTPNRYFMNTKKSQLAQYQFKEIIESQTNKATLLNYGFLDAGFYTVLDILPNCKAFCGLNIDLKELEDLQEYYVQNGLCDYIVTNTVEMLSFDKYECIAESVSDCSYSLETYRLYKLVK